MQTQHMEACMDRSNLSTRDLANLLAINVSTVKRWADGGQLPCIKTPGGHRRFRIGDVQGFLVEHGISAQALTPFANAETRRNRLEEAVLNREWEWLRDHLLALLRDGAVRDIVPLLSAMYLSGLHPAELCDLLIAPAMETIGERWAANELTVADEHLATHAIAAALDEMSTRWPAQRETDRLAICACLPQNYHELACVCASQVLKFEGWNVALLGANTPTEAIIAMIETRRPDLVAISAALVPDPVCFASDCKRIGTALGSYGGQLVVGGAGVMDSHFAPTDGCARVVWNMGAFVDHLKRSFGNHVHADESRSPSGEGI